MSQSTKPKKQGKASSSQNAKYLPTQSSGESQRGRGRGLGSRSRPASSSRGRSQVVPRTSSNSQGSSSANWQAIVGDSSSRSSTPLINFSLPRGSFNPVHIDTPRGTAFDLLQPGCLRNPPATTDLSLSRVTSNPVRIDTAPGTAIDNSSGTASELLQASSIRNGPSTINLSLPRGDSDPVHINTAPGTTFDLLQAGDIRNIPSTTSRNNSTQIHAESRLPASIKSTSSSSSRQVSLPSGASSNDQTNRRAPSLDSSPGADLPQPPDSQVRSPILRAAIPQSLAPYSAFHNNNVSSTDTDNTPPNPKDNVRQNSSPNRAGTNSPPPSLPIIHFSPPRVGFRNTDESDNLADRGLPGAPVEATITSIIPGPYILDSIMSRSRGGASRAIPSQEAPFDANNDPLNPGHRFDSDPNENRSDTGSPRLVTLSIFGDTSESDGDHTSGHGEAASSDQSGDLVDTDTVGSNAGHPLVPPSLHLMNSLLHDDDSNMYGSGELASFDDADRPDIFEGNNIVDHATGSLDNADRPNIFEGYNVFDYAGSPLESSITHTEGFDRTNYSSNRAEVDGDSDSEGYYGAPITSNVINEFCGGNHSDSDETLSDDPDSGQNHHAGDRGGEDATMGDVDTGGFDNSSSSATECDPSDAINRSLGIDRLDGLSRLGVRPHPVGHDHFNGINEAGDISSSDEGFSNDDDRAREFRVYALLAHGRDRVVDQSNNPFGTKGNGRFSNLNQVNSLAMGNNNDLLNGHDGINIAGGPNEPINHGNFGKLNHIDGPDPDESNVAYHWEKFDQVCDGALPGAGEPPGSGSSDSSDYTVIPIGGYGLYNDYDEFDEMTVYDDADENLETRCYRMIEKAKHDLANKSPRDANKESPEEVIRIYQHALQILAANKAAASVKTPTPLGSNLVHRLPVGPEFEELALGILVKVRKAEGGSSVDDDKCSFCYFSCNFGIVDGSLLLPTEASSNFCADCQDTTSSFNDLFSSMGYSHDLDDTANVSVLKEAVDTVEIKVTAMAYQRAKPLPRNTTSQFDGQNIQRFRGIQFCRGSSHRQIDLSKVKICEDCLKEKIDIIKHDHVSFQSIVKLRKNMVHPESISDFERLQSRRCMVCTGHADYKCRGCPLRLCSHCYTILKRVCKFHLDNLFYYYNRKHIRNDAFLLRSDCGGF